MSGRFGDQVGVCATSGVVVPARSRRGRPSPSSGPYCRFGRLTACSASFGPCASDGRATAVRTDRDRRERSCARTPTAGKDAWDGRDRGLAAHSPAPFLVPIGPDNAADLWLLQQLQRRGPAGTTAGDRPVTRPTTTPWCIAESWRLHGVTSGWHTTARPVRSSAAAACRGPRSTTTGPALHVPARCPRCATPCQCRNIRGDRPTVSRVFGWIVDHGLAPGYVPFLRYTRESTEPGGSVGLAQHAVGGFVDGAACGVAFLERCGPLGREVADAPAVYRLGRSRRRLPGGSRGLVTIPVGAPRVPIAYSAAASRRLVRACACGLGCCCLRGGPAAALGLGLSSSMIVLFSSAECCGMTARARSTKS